MSTKKHILIFCPVLSSFGGTETHIVAVCEALANHGWRVTLVIARCKLKGELIDRLRKFGVEVVSWPSIGFVLALARKCDVLYTNSQGRAPAAVWKWFGKSQVGFHHVHTSASKAEQAYWPKGYREFLINANRVVACSETTRQSLLDLGAQGEVSFLPYLSEAMTAGLTPKLNATPEGRPVKFGFIGRVEKAKGLDLIISAARDTRCEGIEWHIFGDGSYVDDVRRDAPPHVYLRGAFVGQDSLQRVLAEVDAVILPSYHSEGMPLSLLEAMSAGKPWIATDQGGTRELGGNHKDLHVIKTGDTEQLIVEAVRLERKLRSQAVDHHGIENLYNHKFAKNVTSEAWLLYVSKLLERDAIETA